MKNNNVIIAGGGIAGSIAAAFLVKEGISVTLMEKEDQLGGLVNSFEREGYVFDGGLRAVESSGLILSTLQELGIDLPLVKSTVSLGVEDRIISLKETEDIQDFENLLKHFYPENGAEIEAIVLEIRKVMQYMMVLLGNEAPVYSGGKKRDARSLRKLLPWLVKLLATIPKLSKLGLPIEEHLKKFTRDPQLTDIIKQHFFKGTPASFALSYFLFYFDYNYPLGGTGSLARAVECYLREKGCDIRTNTKICSLDPEEKEVRDQHGNVYGYDKLIWAADNKYLYSIIDTAQVAYKKLREGIERKRASLRELRGAESVVSVYLGVDLPPSYFTSICTEHLFYTPDRRGISTADPDRIKSWMRVNKPGGSKEDKAYIKQYLKDLFYYNTLEISFPVLRDPDLAPEGKTGMIVSVLFDYDLCRFIYDAGWYDEFKSYSEDLIIDILDKSVFPGLKDSVEMRFSATPLTLQQYTGNTDGAIVGWSFTNPVMPVPHSMIHMPKAVETVLPDVYQAGQWTYSPAGLPISILTGKVAAGKVKKKL
ncbi:MAG: NAD(P)/FAD-dependent oxidoreductase [Fidelibacterota bacterium]